ncbi:hypothetical protein AB0J82_15175 [Asanoa sp. NPDC049518]|uniref:hypothetical protein n=1 Tax=unclassified Asanoa TaxID=2685164 RepID=UPI00343DF613
MTRQSAWRIGLVVTAASMLAISQNVAAGQLPESWKRWLWLAWPITVALSVVVVRSEIRQRLASAPMQEARSTDSAVERLARVGHDQWTDEAATRELTRPDPIRTRWQRFHGSLATRPATTPTGCGDTRFPENGLVADIGSSFLRSERGQLVIIGAAAAGKTAAAILATVDILRTRTEQAPVPVILSVASWRPQSPGDRQLFDWAARQLVSQYPFLQAGRADPAGFARELIRSGRILLVLDGLDEMPTVARAAAIDAIDRLDPRTRLILTCRTREYREAAGAGGRVISNAAVVQLLPVELADAERFLTTNPQTSTEWRRVFGRLGEQENSALAEALRNPMLLATARRAQIDPSDLLRLESVDAVQHRLLDSLVTTAYADDALATGPGLSRRWDPVQARRWLGNVARHLESEGTEDIAWWRLHRMVGEEAIVKVCAAGVATAVGVAFGLISGLSAGFAHVLPDDLSASPDGLTASSGGLLVGLGQGLLGAVIAGGIAFGIVAGLCRPPAVPDRLNLRLRGRWWSLVKELRWAGLLFAGAGLWAAFPAVLSGSTASTVAITAGVIGFGVAGIGAAVGLVRWSRDPADVDRVPTPQRLLRDDRNGYVFRVLTCGLLLGLSYGLWEGLRGSMNGYGTLVLTFGDATIYGFLGGALRVGLLGLALGAILGLGGKLGLGASAWFLCVRARLALSGELPWHLLEFLEDARAKGLLRRAGGVYQFRHNTLRGHLAR